MKDNGKQMGVENRRNKEETLRFVPRTELCECLSVKMRPMLTEDS